MGQLYLTGDTGDDTELGSVTQHEPKQLPPRPGCSRHVLSLLRN